MKILLLIAVTLLATPAFANGLNLMGSSSDSSYRMPSSSLNLLETEKQSRERQSAERYIYQQNSPYNHITGAPLGGYPEKLGSPAPCGTLAPGYVRNKCE